MKLDYTKKTNEIIQWLQQTVHSAGFQQVVVAVSGGVDSAVSLNLAVRALGRDNVYALLLPYGKLSSKALEDGKLVARTAGLEKDHVIVKEITKAVDKITSVIANGVKQSYKDDLRFKIQDSREEILNYSTEYLHPKGTFLAEVALPQSGAVQDDKEGGIGSIRKGNIMARVRMIFLYDFAKANNLLVVGTENKTEYYLGYFTRFGDEASDIEPIRSLYKTNVWEMAKFLEVPQEIIDKAPSANLWEGQSDEKEFGFSYSDADRILYHYFEEHIPEEGLLDLGCDKKLIDTVLGFAKKNDFKHRVPYVFDNRR